MGHRLSRIYTRTGDDGSTGLGDGQRVAKDDARVASYGTVDEANAALGLLLATALPDDVRALVVNAGCANAFTGKAGADAARRTAS